MLMSLDGVAEVLSWSPGELDPHRLNVWAQVVRVAWMIGAKVGIEAGSARRNASSRSSGDGSA